MLNIIDPFFPYNVPFISFFLFTTVQFFFAFLARSQSTIADCAAMTVGVVSYFVNFMAEHLKHRHPSMTPQRILLKRPYLKLIPPSFSVIN